MAANQSLSRPPIGVCPCGAPAVARTQVDGHTLTLCAKCQRELVLTGGKSAGGIKSAEECVEPREVAAAHRAALAEDRKREAARRECERRAIERHAAEVALIEKRHAETLRLVEARRNNPPQPKRRRWHL